jgi:hypothetical protein
MTIEPNPFGNDAQIRLSIGTFSPKFDDLCISFGVPVDGKFKSWMAILPPDQTKHLLKQLTYLLRRDNDKMVVIPIKMRPENSTWEQVTKDHVASWWWWAPKEGSGTNVDELYHCQCGASEGQFHTFGCDYEMCPKCGERLYYECSCFPESCYTLPPGPELEKLITALGRVPNIVYPNHCVRCGELWPYMFMVPDAEWRYYIPKGHGDDMLCEQCYDEIVSLIDKHHPKPVFELTEWEKVHRPSKVIIG